MTYLLTFSWPWHEEQTTWYSKERLISFLRGFAPRDKNCKIYVDSNGKRHEWEHKDVPLAHKRTPQLDRLLAQQKEDNIAASKWLERGRKLKNARTHVVRPMAQAARQHAEEA